MVGCRLCLTALHRVHLVQVCRLSLAILLTSAKMYRIPSFYPLFCSALGASLANMALFRVFGAFLARFGVVVWVCLVCVICVACVGFVRVWS